MCLAFVSGFFCVFHVFGVHPCYSMNQYFLFPANSISWYGNSLFTHVPANGQLGCYCLLAREWCCFEHSCTSIVYLFSVLWGYIPGVELLGHEVILFNFLRNCQTASYSDWPFYIPTSKVCGLFLSSHIY